MQEKELLEIWPNPERVNIKEVEENGCWVTETEYFYRDGMYSFIISEGIVCRLSVDSGGKYCTYSSEQGLFSMIGIYPLDTPQRSETVDTITFTSVNHMIDKVVFEGVDKEKQLVTKFTVFFK